jgi:hypothetical protein
MTSYKYEVHDESGRLRVFYELSKAQQFAGCEYRIVKVKEDKPRRPKISLSDFEPALL